MATRAAIIADYQQKYDTMKVTRVGAVETAAKRIVANMAAYKAVEAKTGVPWAFIGVLHMRECNNDMRGVLHNGERIIGTGRKTRLVPRGRGPFATWEAAAIDALKFDGFYNMADTSPGALCEAGERYNGLGYRNKGRPSPYVWAGSQWYTRGKYVRDGVYSPRTVDVQLGIAPVMKRVMGMAGEKSPSVVGKWATKRQEEKAVVKKSRRLTFQERVTSFIEWLGLGGLLSYGTLQQVRDFATDWRTLGILALGVILWIAFKYSKYLSLREHAEGRYMPSGDLVIPAADPPQEAAE